MIFQISGDFPKNMLNGELNLLRFLIYSCLNLFKYFLVLVIHGAHSTGQCLEIFKMIDDLEKKNEDEVHLGVGV